MINFSEELNELILADKELGSEMYWHLLHHSLAALHNIIGLPYASLCPNFVDDLTLVFTTTTDYEGRVVTHVALAEPEPDWPNVED